MKKSVLLVVALLTAQASLHAQLILSKWIINTTGKTASYWENSNGNPNNPSWVFHTTTDSADVQRVCYTADSVYVKATGMTDNMGKFLNPGLCSTQTFVYCFPRNPVVPTTKTASPASFAVGALLNGIPIYGRGAGKSWGGSGNINGGPQIWNTEVYYNEGFVLDTAFGAHPQQQGQYHTHAKPYRMYESTPTTTHSPIVGYSFDGYPIYGPYAYTNTNGTGAITRMKSGYSLRNITVRQTLPDGTVLNSSQYGPGVSTTYPLGMYCEDYEWLAANGGDLDQYNGRFCVTPEYPSGTYAYFVTLDASLTPQYPYYIGNQYYGTPNSGNFNGGCLTRVLPSSGLTCVSSTGIFSLSSSQKFEVYPNPASGSFQVRFNDAFNRGASVIGLYNGLGQLIYQETISATGGKINIPADVKPGIYFVRLSNESGQAEDMQKLVIE